jgi:phosphoglycerate dehydrogenase-like enzyme
MSGLTVLVGENVGEGNLARMREAFPDVRFLLCLSLEETVAAAPLADVIFTKRLQPELLQAATRLRWVQAGVSGIERWLAAGLRERDLPLTNARGAHGVPMAEFILSMILAFATGLHTLIKAQPGSNRVFDAVIARKFEIEGQRLCVLGAGDIGGTLARKARALGMRVTMVRRSGAGFPDADETLSWDRLPGALPHADHVALCLPLTADTESIIGERELRAMRPTAYLYNVGRGRSIDHDALLRALQEGWIAGAGLDVTEPEPLPDGSPLWGMPNVILGQHTSGSSPFNADRITDIFLENLGRYLSGEELINLVDRQKGY